MFVVEVGSVLTTLLCRARPRAPRRRRARRSGSPALVTLWLWFTVLFANFAEAVAEGRGKAQADTLRKMRKETDGAPAASTAREARRSSARRRCARATSSSSRPGS